MMRKLFTVVALFSLLLCAGTIWWWSSSSDRIDQVTYERHGVQTVNLSGSGGKVVVKRTLYSGAPSDSLRQVSFNSVPLDASSTRGDSNVSLLAVSYAQQPTTGGTISTLIIPTWLIVAVSSLFPGMWFVMRMKRRKPKPQQQ
jgi:hypothetical protein